MYSNSQKYLISEHCGTCCEKAQQNQWFKLYCIVPKHIGYGQNRCCFLNPFQSFSIRHSSESDVERDKTRGECLQETWTEVVTGYEFETHPNTGWKQGLRVSNGISIETNQKKKTSVQLWIMLCSAMWHKTVVTMLNDCCLLSILLSFLFSLFRLRHQPYAFLSHFSTRLVQEILSFPPINNWQAESKNMQEFNYIRPTLITPV